MANIIQHPVIHNVLIIEDERDICYLLSNILRQKDIIAECVFTLKDAEITLEENSPELIFLDNHLPDGLGVNFISQIKKRYPATNIVIVTAHDTSADRENALYKGADYFIGKPFSRDAITAILEKIAPVNALP